MSDSSRASQRAGESLQRRIGVVTLGVLSCFLVVALAGPVIADSNDTTAPTFRDGNRHNASVMEITITDDTDVDERSITVGNFSLSDGSLQKVVTNESGSNARVKLFLNRRLNTDTVTVTVPQGSVITDGAGNAMTNESVTVSGMDSYFPHLRDYEVRRINETDARIALRTNEQLSDLRLEVRGPAVTNLTVSDFQMVEDHDYGIPYVTTLHFPENGEYRLRVASLTDHADHLVNYTRTESFVRDADVPTVIIDGPSHLDTGDLGRFDGAASDDNVGIASYDWRVDGNASGNDTVVEHGFTDPGPHVVTLTVVDSRGNEATVNHSVTVHDAREKQGVTVTPLNGSGVNATVSAGRTEERVRVADAYGRLVGDANITLRSVTVTLPTNETTTMNVTGNATDLSFEAMTGRTALASYTITHGNRTLGDPTFRFAVSPSRLGRAGVSYADVALYRDDGNWTELETDVVRATKSAVVYEATAPGLSTFVVGTASARHGPYGVDDETAVKNGDDGGEAAISVTEALLVTKSVAVGEFAVVNATLVNGGDAGGTYDVGLSVGPRVVTTKPVTVPAGESRQVQFVTRVTRSGTVAVNGTIAGVLSVAEATSPDDGTDPADTETSSSGDARDDGGVPVPNPLALWPDGFVGAVLTAILGIVVALYAVLKALAIYLGY